VAAPLIPSPPDAVIPPPPDFEAASPDTRNALTRGYQEYVAKPVTDVVAQGMRSVTSPFVTAARVAQGEPISQVARYPELSSTPAPTDAAKVLVPQTPTEAGITIGGLALGGPLGAYLARVPKMAKAAPAVGRALGVTTGGAAGDVAEGGSGLSGAATGAFAGTLGEILGSSKVNQMAPGGMKAINRKDAANVAKTVGEISPPLKGASTIRDLREMAAGGGQKTLGAAKDSVNREIDAGLDMMGTHVTVPSLGQTVPTKVLVPPTGGYTAGTAPKPMTLQEANDELSKIGARAFSRDPMERNFNGVDQRQLYGKVRQEILDGLDAADPTGYSRGIFEKMQEQFSKGLTLVGGAGKKGVLDRSGVFRPRDGDEALNMGQLQQMLTDPKIARNLEARLGSADYQKLVQTITRGAGIGGRDALASGPQSPYRVLMDLLFEKSGGSPKLASLPGRLLAPNASSRYIGNVPDVGGTPGNRMLMDILLGVGTDRATRTE